MMKSASVTKAEKEYLVNVRDKLSKYEADLREASGKLISANNTIATPMTNCRRQRPFLKPSIRTSPTFSLWRAN